MNKYDKQHLRNLQRYEAMITALFDAAAKDAAKLSSLINGIGDAPFSWADYPLAKAKIDDIVEQLNSEVFGAVVNGVRSEWSLSNSKNNFLVQTVLGSNADSLPEAVARRYFNNNETAREAFLLRKESGLGLSDNVWRYTNQFKSEIEMALDIGIRSGKSADEISRDVRDYLKYPDKLFRRVRDEHGQLHLSQRASEFHPGRGVYRSSYMNARRLAATETNIAYRTADHLRWQELDFVVGIEIHLSNNHNCKGVPAGTYFDICDELQGRYPKDFKFTGWHPHCRCWVETILKTEAEMAEDNARIMAGEDVSESSENAVDALPDKFNKWVENNQLRIDEARKNGTLPYFLRDNEDKTWFETARNSRFNEGYISLLSDAGIRIPQAAMIMERMKDSPFNRIDVLTLDNDVRSVMAKHGYGDGDITCKMGLLTGGGLRLEWNGKNGFELVRRFFLDKEGRKVVDHDLFELPQALQGKGISKQIFNALYKQYRIAGVERMKVFANIDVGGYTWARYGFCVEDKDTALRSIMYGNLTKRQEDRIVALINKHFDEKPDTPFPMNTIARLPYGKKALLGECWDGILDLTDPTQRRRFEHYLRR